MSIDRNRLRMKGPSSDVQPTSSQPSDGYGFHPIGIVRSCYTGRFGIPRQAGLVTAAEGHLEILPPYAREEAFAGFEGFSHLWLIFVFHAREAGTWRPMVRPPRLGGNRKVGVFASRSPFRPNPIGLSAVELRGIEHSGKILSLRLGGLDLLDGTPVLDIKPYIPYADALPHTTGGFAPEPPGEDRQVDFAPQAERQIADLDPRGKRELSRLIEQILRQDPRPGYMNRRPERTDFGMRLYELEIKWRLTGDRIMVTAVTPAPTEP